jgi:hypothetical protein
MSTEAKPFQRQQFHPSDETGGQPRSVACSDNTSGTGWLLGHSRPGLLNFASSCSRRSLSGAGKVPPKKHRRLCDEGAHSAIAVCSDLGQHSSNSCKTSRGQCRRIVKCSVIECVDMPQQTMDGRPLRAIPACCRRSN